MSFSIAGINALEWMTFAPKYDISIISMKEIESITRASAIILGSVVMTPSTSVQMIISSASTPAPMIAPE